MTRYDDMLFPILVLGILIIPLTLTSKTTRADSPSQSGATTVKTTLNPFYQEDELQAQLFQAVQDVAALHEPGIDVPMSHPADPFQNPPKFVMDHNLMHSPLQDNGFNAREEMQVEKITEELVRSDLNDTRWWKYFYFNNSEILLAALPNYLVMWRLNLHEEFSSFALTNENAFAVLGPFEGNLMDTILYIRETICYEESMFLAVSSLLNGISDINVYRIEQYEVKHVHLIRIEETVLRMTYLRYLDEGTLSLLVESTRDEHPIALVESGSKPEIPTILKVSIPSAVDMVSFYSRGYNFITVTNASTCSIFSFGQDTVEGELFDMISLQEVVSLQTFVAGNNRFLISAGSSQQNVFLVDSNKLILRQSLTETLVLEAFTFSVSSCRDDTLLVLLRESQSESLQIFIWKSDQFVSIPRELFPGTALSLPRSLTAFNNDKVAYLMLVDQQPSIRTRIFSIHYNVSAVINPVLTKGESLSTVMEHLEVSLKEEENLAYKLSQILSNAVQPSSIIKVPQIFSNVEVELNTISHRVIGDSIIWDRSNLTIEDLKWTPEYLQSELDKLEAEILRLEQILEDVVMLNDSAIISGHKDFHGMLQAQALEFESLTLPKETGAELINSLAKVYRTDRPHLIKGETKIMGNLHVAGNVNCRLVNNLSLQTDILLTSVPQDVTGPVTFDSTFTVEGDIAFMNAKPVIGGIPLDEVITVNGRNTLNSFVNFTNTIRITDSLTSPVIDGVNLTELMETALVMNQEQVMDSISLRSIVVPATRISQIIVTGSVNEIDLGSLVNQMVQADSPANFTGSVVLNNPVFEGGLVIGGRYDGVHFPASIFRRDIPQIVTATKHFKQLSAVVMGVRGKIDGLRLPEDVISLTKDETLHMPLTMNGGISVDGSVEVSGLVDGFKLDEILRKASVSLQRKMLNAVFHGPVIIEGHLVVAKYSESDMQRLRDDLIFPEDKYIEFMGDKKFHYLRAEGINLEGKLNGYNLTTDFMTQAGDQIIKGNKIFRSPVQFGKNLITGGGMINNVNLVELYKNRISIYQDSVILGSLSFKEPFRVRGDFKIGGKLNNLIFPDDVVLRNAPRIIMENKVFRGGISVQDLVVKNDLKISRTLDGVHLDNFLKERVSLSQDQILLGKYIFGAGNSVSRIEATFINGINLETFASEVVLASVPQVVVADTVEFSGTTFVFGEIVSDHGFNGVRFDEISNHVIRLDRDLFFGETIIFENDLIVKGDLQSSSVNEIDIKKFNGQVVRRKDTQLSGTNTFFSDIHVKGNIYANTVNGINLKKDVFLKTSNQTITAKYYFTEVFIEKNLSTPSTVCGLDLSEFQHQVLRTDRHSVLNGNLLFRQSLVVSEDIDVAGMVNHVNLSVFKEDGVFIDLPEQVLSTVVLMGPVRVYGDVIVETLNGIDLQKKLDDMVFINEESYILGSKIFTDPVTVSQGEVNVRGHLNIAGTINGVNIQKWVKEVIFLNEPQVAKGHITLIDNVAIEGSLIVQGKINDVNINTDVLLQDTDAMQRITGFKSFRKLTTTNSITVLGLVNGHHLPTLVRDTLSISGNQTVQAAINVKGFVEFIGAVHGSINGLDLAMESIRLDSPIVELGGNIVFTNDLIIDGDLNPKGRVCHVDVPQLAVNAIYKDRDQVIQGSLHFENVTFTDAIVLGQVAGVDIKTFEGNLEKFKSVLTEQQEELESKNKILDSATNFLNESGIEIGAYSRRLEHFQSLNITGYVTDYYNGQVEIYSKNRNVPTFSMYGMQNDGKFAHEETKREVWAALMASVHFNDRVFRLWIDQQGNARLTGSNLMILNVSDVLDGDMMSYDENEFLLATLHPGFSHLRRIPRNSEGYFNSHPVVIENGPDARSIHLVGNSSPIYVAIDVVPSSNQVKETCSSHSDTSLQLFAWDVQSEKVTFVQELGGAARSLKYFFCNGFEYLVKVDKNDELVGYPSMNLKLYRKESVFSLVSALTIQNIQDMDLFQDQQNQVYLAVTNATHLILSYFAGIRGFVVHSTVPCYRAFGVTSFVAENNALFLAVGQARDTTMKGGTVQLFRFSSPGLKANKLRYRRWS